MRSMWKGHIRFSLVTIPVQIFNAVDNSSEIQFRQLHSKDNGAIQYKKVCGSCNEEIPFADIVKGYEYSPENYVVLKPEELATLKIKSNKVIDIEAFVDLHEVSPSRFESVYFIGPLGDIAHATFGLLIKTLQKTGKAGVGRITIRDREDVVLIKAEGYGLVMYKMRYPDELRSIKDVPDLKEPSADDAQLALAETLVNSLVTTFDAIPFVDKYKESVLDMVKTKIDGKEVVSIAEEKEEAPVVDIMQALKASIEAAKKKTS